jgi:hypothetical protein
MYTLRLIAKPLIGALATLLLCIIIAPAASELRPEERGDFALGLMVFFLMGYFFTLVFIIITRLERASRMKRSEKVSPWRRSVERRKTWIRLNRRSSETLDEAAERLTPLWYSAYDSDVLTHARRRAAAVAVVTRYVGGTVIELDTSSDREGFDLVAPLEGEDHLCRLWAEMMMRAAPLSQTVLDGSTYTGGVDEFPKSLGPIPYHLVASGWLPADYEGALSSCGLIDHAVSEAGRVLGENREVVDAIEKALKDSKDGILNADQAKSLTGCVRACQGPLGGKADDGPAED